MLLIFDEVVTGFRFSPGGAQGLYGLGPDLSCFAKVVAGGMPGGAVVGREDIMALFDLTGDAYHDRFARVVHQGTFNGAPLSAAAGVAVLKQVATGEPIGAGDGGTNRGQRRGNQSWRNTQRGNIKRGTMEPQLGEPTGARHISGAFIY